ncbi:MAG: thiol-disulfide oxidoreductase DCC family protein [Bacteroidota bacterium]|jgi:predicted DCC family thiol-disulfide oxidoreductase YuxK
MEKSIVFFDSDCIMCSRFALLIFKYDKYSSIYFASLNSDFYKSIKQSSVGIMPEETVVFYKSADEIYYRSEAVFQIIRQLKFPFNLLIVFNILPKSILDSLYRFIASRRKKWFGNSGKKCSIVQSKFSDRILK